MSLLAYDQSGYGAAFSHLGGALPVQGWPGPVLRRAIPDTDRHDLSGAWPYASVPANPAAAREAWAGLKATGAVAFQALARPDAAIDPAMLRAAGFETRPLKEHFVHDPARRPVACSTKTRANLNRARRTWRIVAGALAPHLPLVCRWHDELNRRRRMSALAALAPGHFARLATLAGFTALLAEDEHGPAACLIVADSADAIHFHAIAGDERAYRGRAFYALYDDALARWGETRRIYFGGAPAGPEGAGIARFKARFANHRVAIHLITATLDAGAYAALVARRHTPGWFPAYRGPIEQPAVRRAG